MDTVNDKNLIDRNIEYDVLRILLTGLVVIGHVNYTGYDENLYSGISHFFIHSQDKLLSWIYGFHMPAFMFLSGMLFYVRKYNSLDEVIWDKFKKLIVPAYLLQVFVILPIKLFTGIIDKVIIMEKYRSLFLGIEGVYDHLWFMIALFWCCIFFYFPCKYLFDRQNIVLGFVACVFLSEYISKLPFSNDFYLFRTGLTYLFVFASGWVYNKKHIGRKIKTIYKLLYLFCYICFITGNYNLEKSNMYVLQAAGILAVTFLSEIISCGCIHREKVKRIIIFLSRETRYIYYFHVPFIWVSVIYLREKYTAKSVVGWFVLEVIGCMSLPVLGSKMIKKLTRIACGGGGIERLAFYNLNLVAKKMV